MKVFWLFNHPAPYKVDFFNVLGESIELDVLFERSSEGGRNDLFYGEKPNTFHSEVAHSLWFGPVDNLTFRPLHYLKKKDYDIIVLNGWRTLSEQIAIHYCKKHHIPYVFYINGGIPNPKEKAWIAKRKRACIEGASAYFSPDPCSAQYLTYYGADPDKITLYPYSSIFERELSDRPRSEEEKQAIRKEFGLNARHLYVSSGQYIPRKNFEELIALWPSMPKDSLLVITGEGPLKGALLEQKERLGLDNVLLWDYIPHDKLLHLFQGADAFVLLSKEDIYGHVVNEALSQGIPVIAGNNINAGKHLIHDGINGFVVELGNPSSILEALTKVLDPAYQEAALAVARQNTIEASAKFHLAFFEEYLRSKTK